MLLAYGRHLGFQKLSGNVSWLARVRTKKGTYVRKVLGSGITLSCDDAIGRAHSWFNNARVVRIAADSRPIGARRELAICPIGSVFTVGSALFDYVEWKRLAAARSHFETNLSLINFHLIPRLGNLPLADFNGEVLKTFVRDVLETSPKRGGRRTVTRRSIESLEEDELRKRKGTVNTLIGILRVAMKMAWENGKTDNDRAWRSLRRLPVVHRPRVLHLSRDECRALLAACRPDLARLVLAALYTGCRATELLRMRCNQVGRDGYGVYVAPVKAYRPRFVFLPDEAMIWFLDLIRGRRPSDLIFVRDSGKPWFGNYKHLFRAAVRVAELPEEFTFHGLRHTYASQLIQAGATVFVVADQLGHVDPATVLRTYGHLSPQIRESEVRQRFGVLDPANARFAAERFAELSAWRGRLHGTDWREYARITDVRGPDRPLRLTDLGDP